MKAPFPYFGGKRTVAANVWRALGQPKRYIEPFFGSGAVLLNRPGGDPRDHIETICDADGHIANVWRALQADPDAVAKVCDWPVNHADLSARKMRLCREQRDLLGKLTTDPDYYDATLAGYWIWAASCWIGSGMTSPGQRPHISGGGKGVHAMGQIPHISRGGKGVQEPYTPSIYTWFRELSERLRRVQVVCGDWPRVCGGNWQDASGIVGMFFDPPYGCVDRDTDIYAHDSTDVAHEVRDWCLSRGDNPRYRIVLAGYEEHVELERHGWRVEQWSANGGYGNIGKDDTGAAANRHRECLYYSPHCLDTARQTALEY